MTGYYYELWDSGKVIGHYHCLFKLDLIGRYCILPVLKQSRAHQKIESIRVPIIYRQIPSKYDEVSFKVSLDISRTSKSQRKLLLMRSSLI